MMFERPWFLSVGSHFFVKFLLFCLTFLGFNLKDVQANTLKNVTVNWRDMEKSVDISGACLPSATNPASEIKATIAVTTWGDSQTVSGTTTCSPSRTFSLTVPNITQAARRIRTTVSFGTSLNAQSLQRKLGMCKTKGNQDHDHEDGDHHHGDHSTCGCEDGSLMIHGMKMDLPATTRVISTNTSMSEIVASLAENEVIEIGHGATLEYDVTSDKSLRAVVIYGSLNFNPQVDTRMVVGDLIVAPTGSLTIGTSASPIAANKKAEILLGGYPINPDSDPYQLGNGLIGLGEVTIHGRPMTEPGIRFAAAPNAGDSVITLERSVNDWYAGDNLVFADTRQLANTRWTSKSQTEYRKISAIQGNKLTLDQPLKFAHAPIVLPNISGQLSKVRHIEAINTTRNVVIRSRNTVGELRAHTMFVDRAKVDLRYAAFTALGRTTKEPLNETECDQSGELINYGSNQIGRYAIHTHFLRGRENPENTGYQFVMIGLDVSELERWGIAPHNSSFGLFKDISFHRVKGVALAFETGDETGNTVVGNRFVGSMPDEVIDPTSTHVRGGVSLDDTFRRTFSGKIAIWDAPGNDVRDNKIYGHWQIGYALNSYYVLPQTPKFRGADPMDPNQNIQWAASKNDDNNRTEAAPVGEKRNNEIIAPNIAFYVAFPRGKSLAAYTKTPAVYDRFIIANVGLKGMENYHNSNEIYSNFIMVNDPQVANRSAGIKRYTIGFNLASSAYESAKMKIISDNSQAVIATPEGAADSDGIFSGTYVAGFHVGLDGPFHAKDGTTNPQENTTVVEGGIWSNWYNFRNNLATDRVARVLRISEVDLRTPSNLIAIPGFTAAPLNVVMNYEFNYTDKSYPLTADNVFLERWALNGRSAPNLRLFYNEQDPKFIVPVSFTKGPNGKGPAGIVAAVEPNLTNEQHLLKYGTSIGGSLAPCNAAGGLSCDALKTDAASLGIYGIVERK